MCMRACVCGEGRGVLEVSTMCSLVASIGEQTGTQSGTVGQRAGIGRHGG